mmetsp:Transcript_17814/g.54458  ORF Transcript_17814/g.54458 Transcript_17814/m.54458 type:complete len:444 (+) Transcript_17814:139-1470(+)
MTSEAVLFWDSFVALQLAISGSGALPVARAFAVVGWKLGLVLCFLTGILNKATTAWLVESAFDAEEISYSGVCERAGFGPRARLVVELFTLTLMTGSFAVCLAAFGETCGRATESERARILAPALGVFVAAVLGSRDYAGPVMAFSSVFGVAFLLALAVAVLVQCLRSRTVSSSSSSSWEEGAPAAVATLGYSFYLAPVALAMFRNHWAHHSERVDRAAVVRAVNAASALTFATTFVVYGVLGVSGSLWLGSETPGDVATAFPGRFIASFVALYLAVGLLPMFHPLEDSVRALFFGGHDDARVRVCSVAALVLAALAAQCNSITLFAFTGATGVCVTCYVVPVLCFWRTVRPANDKRRRRQDDDGLLVGERARIVVVAPDKEDAATAEIPPSSRSRRLRVLQRWAEAARETCLEVLFPALALAFGVGISVLSLAIALAGDSTL